MHIDHTCQPYISATSTHITSHCGERWTSIMHINHTFQPYISTIQVNHACTLTKHVNRTYQPYIITSNCGHGFSAIIIDVDASIYWPIFIGKKYATANNRLYSYLLKVYIGWDKPTVRKGVKSFCRTLIDSNYKSFDRQVHGRAIWYPKMLDAYMKKRSGGST